MPQSSRLVCLHCGCTTLQYEYVVCNESSSGTGAAVDLFAVLDLGDAQPKKQKDFAFARVNASRHSVAAGLAQLPVVAVAQWRDGSEKVAYNDRCRFAIHTKMGKFLSQPENVQRSMAQSASWDVLP